MGKLLHKSVDHDLWAKSNSQAVEITHNLALIFHKTRKRKKRILILCITGLSFITIAYITKQRPDFTRQHHHHHHHHI